MIPVTLRYYLDSHPFSTIHTTLDRAFDDLDGDSLASGQAAVAPAIIYFIFHAFLSL